MTSATSNDNVPESLLQVKKLRPEATLPTRGSEWSAGYDLSSAESKTIEPGARAVVKTALAIACPAGTYGRVAPRSGLTVKKGIHVGAGVIDADYRGEVGVVLFNLGQEAFEIQPGDRIAQLVLEKIVMASVQEVDELDETVRGAGGFGSTGVSASDVPPRKRPKVEDSANGEEAAAKGITPIPSDDEVQKSDESS